MSQSEEKPKKPKSVALTRKELEQKAKELAELEQMIKYKQGLPHLFGYPFYNWSRRVFDSKNKEILCTAANQISKSSTAIRKNIHLATSPTLWKEFWPDLPEGKIPSPFWYFYPSSATCSNEFEEKWIKEFLPRGDFKDHPQFGWKAEYDKGNIYALHFNTGVSIYFKNYMQRLINLQASSVYHLTLDEEAPVEFIPELTARLNATNGNFLTVFTATLGQDYWRRAMHPKPGEEVPFPNALKMSVSLYDCITYEDGSPSPWTSEKIARAEMKCTSQAEIDRRIHGKFVRNDGLMFESFDTERNLCDRFDIPKDWAIYGAVDPGTGGSRGHPAAMCLVAVDPDCTKGVVFRAWRGDGVSTTSEDILVQFRRMKGSLKPVVQVYDYAARDFYLIASRAGEPFIPADKKRDSGIALINTLFKNGMLKIFKDDPELAKLVVELTSLGTDTPKTVARDDLIDSLRYCAASIPWNISELDIEAAELGKKKALEDRPLTSEEQRTLWIRESEFKTNQPTTIEEEIDEWSALIDDF